MPIIRKTRPGRGEHQALVRARVVYGDPQLTAHFDAVRREIMTLPREGKAGKRSVEKCARKCALIWQETSRSL
ncbi:hypothetical protein ACLB1O_28675 [Escherichia coli]